MFALTGTRARGTLDSPRRTPGAEPAVGVRAVEEKYEKVRRVWCGTFGSCSTHGEWMVDYHGADEPPSARDLGEVPMREEGYGATAGLFTLH
jgi:hypothetical protein